jgi:alkylation response protein AidB-like acyl-CoA dehydrogenase
MIELTLSGDQQQILDGAVALLAEQSPVSRLRPSGKPKDVHREVAVWGWFGVGLPEERGGLGLGVVEEALLGFEAGRHLLPLSVLATMLAAHLCRDDLLSGLVNGETRAGLALVDGDDAFVFDRGGSSLLLAIDGDHAWIAPTGAFRGEAVVGFDDAIATEKGMIDRAARHASAPIAHARLLISAMLAGIARASCDLAVEYAKVREQFGQPIGAFQAIKHMCADMGLRAYAAEAHVKLAAAAAAAAADAPVTAPFLVNAAALTTLRAARDNASDSIQVHGGIGFTAECDAHFYLKRAHVLGRLLGGLAACRGNVLAHPVAEIA